MLFIKVHETARVFHDRLVDDKDRDWFNTLIQEKLKLNLEFMWEKEKFSQFIFSDIISKQGDYIKIDVMQDFIKKSNDSLNNYNAEFPKNMNLVFFKNAIDHLSRISRILRQTRG